MVSIYLRKQLHGLKLLKIKPRGAVDVRVVSFHTEKEVYYVNEGDRRYSSEWYEIALVKLQKWTNMLKNLDMIEGKLVDVNENKRVFDDKLEKKMHVFKAVARIFIGHPSMQEYMRNTVVETLHAGDMKFAPPFFFVKPVERKPMVVDSLTKICTHMNVKVCQRKEVRLKICPQVTHYHVWVTTLAEVLKRLKSEIDVVRVDCSRKEFRLAEQIIFSCLKIFESVVSYEPESTSWMRVAPRKVRIPVDGPRWEDVVQMFNDLIDCLDEEKDLFLHVKKVEAMKEGLYQIRDFVIDKNIGYKHNKHQESSVQKQLSYALGHSSGCLFTLLLYYLYGIVSDLEVDLCGAVYKQRRGNRYYLCMGKILTSTEEKMLQNGMEQLDRVLKLFKFVWETAGMKGDLEVQGHLFCVGADDRLLSFRGNSFFLHDLCL